MYNNEYIKTYLDMLNKKQISKKDLIIEENKKRIKNRLYKNIILEAQDIECVVIYPNKEINKETIQKNNPELKDIDARIKTYKTDILKAFNIKPENIGETLQKSFQHSFNNNDTIKSLPNDINFIILNKNSNSVAYKAKDSQFKELKNVQGKQIFENYQKNNIIKSFYTAATIKIDRNRKTVKNTGSKEELKELEDFKNNICKRQYQDIFQSEIGTFNKQYTGSIGKTLDIFNWFHDNFILSSNVYIYKFAKDSPQLLKNDDQNKNNVLILKQGEKVTTIDTDLLKSIISNNSNDFIYHIQSIRDLLNAIILEKMNEPKNLEIYKKFQNTVRKNIVNWIQQKISKYEKCSLQALIGSSYEKVNPPVTSQKQQIDYNKKSKDILKGFKVYKAKEAKQFKALAKTNPDLYNDILYVLNESDKPGSNKNIKPFATILKQGKNISIKEYNELEKLEKEFVSIIGTKQAYSKYKDSPESIDNIPQKEKDAAYKKRQNDPNFNKTCKMLGFKDKKQKKGFAALIQRMIEGLLSFFGGNDDPTQANSSAIQSAMPFVKNHIKAIPPGKYPVYFGNGNVSKDEMMKKFQELIK